MKKRPTPTSNAVSQAPDAVSKAPDAAPVCKKPRSDGAGVTTQLNMFTPQLCEKREDVPTKKLKVDKIDKRGMSKLTAFFKRKV